MARRLHRAPVFDRAHCGLSAHLAELGSSLMVQNEYEKAMASCLHELRDRLHWLRLGTKAIFGQLLCDTVCIVIDISDSMQAKMMSMRDKLKALLKEQVPLFLGCLDDLISS
jgi:hypothetical protein